MPYNVEKHSLPEGHEIVYEGKRRTGSVCGMDGHVHTIAELVGRAVCPCGEANTVTPEP
jgi:hypothetical protein